MSEETITTQKVEGVPTEIGSQATVPEGQPSEQPQETKQPQVEGEAQLPSNQTSERPKPSDFFYARDRHKRRIEALENELKQLREELKKVGSIQKPSDVPKREFSEEEFGKKFWEDPVKAQLELRKILRDEYEEKLKKLQEEDFPKRIEAFEKERETKKILQEHERKGLEALELLFPKDESTKNLNLAERIDKNPVRSKRIFEIMDKYGLQEASREKPIEAAEAALKLYEIEQSQLKKPNPIAGTKGQAGSVVTGTPIGGGKKMSGDEIVAELKKMSNALETNPELRYDDKFIEKKSSLLAELKKQEIQSK